MHEVLVNRIGGLSLPRKSVVRLTDRPGMMFTVDVKQQCNNNENLRLKVVSETDTRFLSNANSEDSGSFNHPNLK